MGDGDLVWYALSLKNKLIMLGKQCQTKIFEQKQEYEERERLKKDFERLDNMRLTYLFKKEDNEGSEEVMQVYVSC